MGVLATLPIRKKSGLSCRPPIGTMQPSEHARGNDLALGGALHGYGCPLPHPLVGPSLVVVPDVLGDASERSRSRALHRRDRSQTLSPAAALPTARGAADYVERDFLSSPPDNTIRMSRP